MVNATPNVFRMYSLECIVVQFMVVIKHISANIIRALMFVLFDLKGYLFDSDGFGITSIFLTAWVVSRLVEYFV